MNGNRSTQFTPPKGRFFLLVVLITGGIIGTYKLYGENSITPFTEDFAFYLYGNFNIIGFTPQDDGQYGAQSPWSLGLGIRYKNISASFSVPLYFDNNPFDIQINSYFEKIYYEAFFKRYRNFQKEEGGNDAGLSMVSGGILAGWIQNNKHHSLSSIYNLDKKQTVSSGSFLYGFGVFYTSVHISGENDTRYAEKRRLVYFGPMGGYSYTWILGQVFCNLNLSVGLNAGIDAVSGTALFVPQIMPKLTVGHHNKSWSVNFIGGCTYTGILWNGLDGGMDTLLTAVMTLTFSRRF
jgi:hypothetical protein